MNSVSLPYDWIFKYLPAFQSHWEIYKRKKIKYAVTLRVSFPRLWVVLCYCWVVPGWHWGVGETEDFRVFYHGFGSQLKESGVKGAATRSESWHAAPTGTAFYHCTKRSCKDKFSWFQEVWIPLLQVTILLWVCGSQNQHISIQFDAFTFHLIYSLFVQHWEPNSPHFSISRSCPCQKFDSVVRSSHEDATSTPLFRLNICNYLVLPFGLSCTYNWF